MSDHDPHTTRLTLPEHDWAKAGEIFADIPESGFRPQSFDEHVHTCYQLTSEQGAVYQVMRTTIEPDSLYQQRNIDIFGLLPAGQRLFLLQGYNAMDQDQKETFNQRIISGEIFDTNPIKEANDVLDLHNILLRFYGNQQRIQEIAYLNEQFKLPAARKTLDVITAFSEMMRAWSNLSRRTLGLPDVP